MRTDRAADARGLLHAKLCLVTGGAQGLGAAIAAGLAQQGAQVIIADANEALAQRHATDLCAQGHVAYAYALDVTRSDDVQAVAQRIDAELGAIDLLVNNAGIAAPSRFDDPDCPAVWDKVLSVNLQGTFNVSHAFVPALKRTSGAIVNLCSIVAYGAGISSIAYVVSKGGVRSLTQAMARDLAPFGIRVNAVAPGVMDTSMTARQRDVPGGLDWYLSRTPMARTGAAHEVVGPIVFLASAMASYVTGAIVPVDGGYLAV